MANVERAGSGRVLKGTAGTLEVLVTVDGTATDPTVASVAVVDGQGNSVTVGAAAIVGDGSGRVTAALDDAQAAESKTLVATWTLTVSGNSQTFVTYHQVVGDALFSEAELRAFDAGAAADTATYPDAALVAMHELVAEAFEQIVGTAMGLRFTREYLDGDGSNVLWVKNTAVGSVLAAATRARGTNTWTALTVDELATVVANSAGRVVRESGYWPQGTVNVRVDYTYGLQPVPFELKRAAMWVARTNLVGSNLPRRAITQLDPLGSYRLAVPGERGSWFGDPEVDRVLRDYRARYHVPGVG